MLDDGPKDTGIDELEADPTLINEPIREAIERPGAKQRQIHAIIAERLASAEACWVDWRPGCMYRTIAGGYS